MPDACWSEASRINVAMIAFVAVDAVHGDTGQLQVGHERECARRGWLAAEVAKNYDCDAAKKTVAKTVDCLRPVRKKVSYISRVDRTPLPPVDPTGVHRSGFPGQVI